MSAEVRGEVEARLLGQKVNSSVTKIIALRNHVIYDDISRLIRGVGFVPESSGDVHYPAIRSYDHKNLKNMLRNTHTPALKIT